MHGLPGKMASVRMRPGIANLEDGLNFVQNSKQPILELGESCDIDDLGVVYLRVIEPSGDPRIGQRWYMTYHTRGRGKCTCQPNTLVAMTITRYCQCKMTPCSQGALQPNAAEVLRLLIVLFAVAKESRIVSAPT